MIVTGVLCIPALGSSELPPHEDGPFLIGRPHPTLAGIDKLHIVILPSGTETNENEPVWAELEAKVISRFNKAGIEAASGLAGSTLNIPELRVHIEMLELAGSQKHVFRVQTLLSRVVYLAQRREIASSPEPGLILKANVWMTRPTMEAVSQQDMPGIVEAVVLRQAGYFVEAYLAANPPGEQRSDLAANEADSPTTQEMQPKSNAERVGAEYGYVASKRSDVFHKSECRWANKISPENFVGYSNKAEATESGKRPCRSCKP